MRPTAIPFYNNMHSMLINFFHFAIINEVKNRGTLDILQGVSLVDKKIYVVGLDDEATEAKVNNAVKAVAGVSNCVANSSKAQVLVSFDENTAGIEDAINAAISSCGLDVL